MPWLPFFNAEKKIWWIKYYAKGRQVYHSLNTTLERVALRVKRQIEGEEAKGELLAPSQIPLPAFLQDYCQFLSTIRTHKSYKNDVSFLRIFFGPVCPVLKLGSCVNTGRHSSANLCPRCGRRSSGHRSVGGMALEAASRRVGQLALNR